ncbi:MAG: Fic family protein [Anaerolineaceae bacterium]|nr:Fic family protein [Anaerolineaceae bacterium]
MSFDPTYPHSLEPLPPATELTNAGFGDLLLKARVALAELKGACLQIPNPLLLTSPAAIRESVASSNIENINTTLAEVLQWQLFPEAEQRQPDKEVLRYREALYWGFDHLKNYPISSRLILGIQQKLIPEGSGVYRREQNQIVNMATRESRYTPPPAQTIPDLISNWQAYVNNKDQALDPLIRAIIAHYQFEAIHPFRDGNGRTGRILMVLQLIQDELLTLPVLYISGYINKHRTEYYRTLLEVTSDNKWDEFIKFMLTGFYEQAGITNRSLMKINNLFYKQKTRIKVDHKKIYSADLIDALFTYPVITPTKLAVVLDKHYTTTSKYLTELSSSGILKEAIVGKYHLYANHELLDILKSE